MNKTTAEEWLRNERKNDRISHAAPKLLAELLQFLNEGSTVHADSKLVIECRDLLANGTIPARHRPK